MPTAGAAHTCHRTRDIGQEASWGVLAGQVASVLRYLVESAVPQSSSFLVYHKWTTKFYIYYKSIATRAGDRWSVEGHDLHLA
ncbi:hypothetical protein E2C01_017941 [Portunus trituberculatus]|uniref:Uncharacterized protein n=1 Tax=Portunus trituberculatus TaxID=210409 RepID=A0A5B7DUV8_PORTR|nr:hypothetical protein [Portunus trituberculatus]